MTPSWMWWTLLAGCGAGPDAAGEQTVATAVPGTCAEPSVVELRRLTHRQYENTVWAAADLLGGEPLVLALNDPLPSLLQAVPDDVTEHGLSREDTAVTQAHADAWYAVAELVADTAILPEHRVEAFDGCLDASCVPEVVEPLVSRLLRRPLNPEELSFYVDEVYGDAPSHLDGLRDVVLVALASPHFVFQVEHGDGQASGELVALTAHEVASRLSYHFWSGPPDDALWTLAEDGSILDDAVYAEQVQREFADRRTEAQLDAFFSEWLELDAIAAMDQLVGDPRFDAFAGADSPSPQLTADLQEDALGLIRWHIAHGGTLDDLWTSDLDTVPSPEVAALYGDVPVWDGVSEPVPLGTGVHAGLLTRPAFTASGLPSTRPIHKGVLVRRRVLCDELGAPPRPTSARSPTWTPPPPPGSAPSS